MTDPARLHLDANVSVAGLGNIALDQLQRTTRLGHLYGLHSGHGLHLAHRRHGRHAEGRPDASSVFGVD
jgi:hypothetical protein